MNKITEEIKIESLILNDRNEIDFKSVLELELKNIKGSHKHIVKLLTKLQTYIRKIDDLPEKSELPSGEEILKKIQKIINRFASRKNFSREAINEFSGLVDYLSYYINVKPIPIPKFIAIIKQEINNLLIKIENKEFKFQGIADHLKEVTKIQKRLKEKEAENQKNHAQPQELDHQDDTEINSLPSRLLRICIEGLIIGFIFTIIFIPSYFGISISKTEGLKIFLSLGASIAIGIALEIPIVCLTDRTWFEHVMRAIPTLFRYIHDRILQPNSTPSPENISMHTTYARTLNQMELANGNNSDSSYTSQETISVEKTKASSHEHELNPIRMEEVGEQVENFIEQDKSTLKF